jgi:hypothetical protein
MYEKQARSVCGDVTWHAQVFEVVGCCSSRSSSSSCTQHARLVALQPLISTFNPVALLMVCAGGRGGGYDCGAPRGFSNDAFLCHNLEPSAACGVQVGAVAATIVVRHVASATMRSGRWRRSAGEEEEGAATRTGEATLRGDARCSRGPRQLQLRVCS